MDYTKIIRNIPDFPKEGIQFKDLTTLWKDPAGLKNSIDEIVAEFKDRGITKVVGAESRGFIVGTPVAYLLGAGFIPVRKPGKLPAQTIEKSYSLEYGTNTIQIHKDAISPGDKVLLVDDLLATGGTAQATEELITQLGGEVVGNAFLIELDLLKGRDKLKAPVFTLVHFDI